MKTVIYYCKQTSQCGNRINSYRGLQGEDTERPTTGSIRKAGGKRYGGKENQNGGRGGLGHFNFLLCHGKPKVVLSFYFFKTFWEREVTREIFFFFF